MREKFATLSRAVAMPRMRLEFLAAAVLTAFALALVVRQVNATASLPPKVSLQAQPAIVPAVVQEDEAVAEFIEKFALSRVATRAGEEIVPKAELAAAPVVLAAVATTADASMKPQDRKSTRLNSRH